MAVYTGKGDKGTTGVITSSGKRVDKDDVLVETLGTIDELNSFVGVAVSSVTSGQIKKKLLIIQNDLLRLGSILAGSKLDFPVSETKKLEKLIDELEGVLPVLSSFVLPGGTGGAGALHVARSVCRRAERCLVRLAKDFNVNPHILSYINRLSDYLFMASRLENKIAGIGDVKWVK